MNLEIGDLDMANTSERTVRRHLRDKATIERVAKGVHAPETVAEGEPALQSPTTSTGLPVEDQVRKEWDSHKGGLPIFY
jgi:hypothetical protein